MVKQHRYQRRGGGGVEKDRTFRIDINKFILKYMQIIHEETTEEELIATAAIKTKVDGKTDP